MCGRRRTARRSNERADVDHRSLLLPRRRGHLRVLRPLGPPLLHLVRFVRRGGELDEPVEVEPGGEGVVGLARGVVTFGIVPVVWPCVKQAIVTLLVVQGPVAL